MAFLMTRKMRNAAVVVMLAGTFMCGASAAFARYVEASQFDLVHILAPPPVPSTPEGKADLEAVLMAQSARTPSDVERAQADDEISVFRFADVMGPGFAPDNVPFTAAFFRDIGSDANQAIAAAKDHFNRPRPMIEDRRVEPVIKAANASYPSGAATFAYVTAILLADMVPEKAAAIFDRAATFARNRVVAGVHYPTDIEGGHIAGAVIDNVLLHDRVFTVDFAKARAEVRRAIGLQ